MSPSLPRTVSMVLSYIPAKTTVLPPSELPMLCLGAARLSYKPSFWQNQPSRALLCSLSNSFKLANVIDVALPSWKKQAHKMVLWAGCFDDKLDDLGSTLRPTWWRGKATTISLISTDKRQHASHQNKCEHFKVQKQQTELTKDSCSANQMKRSLKGKQEKVATKINGKYQR